MRYLTPSNISPWEGTPVEGSPYTVEQIRALSEERPNWTRFTNRPVTLSGPPSNRWTPAEQIIVQCPIIAWTKDNKRVQIVTPAGDKKWVDTVCSFTEGR